MARLTLDERQLRLAATGLEKYAADAHGDDNLDLALELSLLQLTLLTAAEESLDRDRNAIRSEYGI